MKRSILITGILLYTIGLLSSSGQELEQVLQENKVKAEAYMAEGKQTAAAQLYNQSAYILRSANRLDEAAELYEKVLEINDALGNKNGQMVAHNSLSMVYLEAERYQKAIQHLEKEYPFRKAANNKVEMINVLTNLAFAHNELSEFDQAITNIEQAIAYSKELNDLTLLKQCYGVAFDIFEKKGDAKRSREYFELYSAFDKELKEQKMEKITDEANRKVNVAVTEKKLTEEELSQTHEKLEKTESTLQEVEELTREQKMELDLREALLEKEKLKRKYLTLGIIALSVFVIVLTIMILKIRQANRKINQQRLSLQKQNKEIRASIRYAQTIQDAMLPGDNQIRKFFDPFIIYMPKDIVSGDFYWIHSEEMNGKTLVYMAVVDCTGHGVPGAFMSMIGNRLLNEIVAVRKIDSPAEILGMLNTMVREALRQEETDNNDGMDLGFCKFEINKNGKYKMTYAGAKRPVYIIRNKENKLLTDNGDRKSIGGYNLSRREVQFTNHERELDKGDMIYLFSDGIIDQNGPDRKKFGRLRLEEVMVDCAKLRPEEQRLIIEQRLGDYMQGEDQRDDITLIGLKVI